MEKFFDKCKEELDVFLMGYGAEYLNGLVIYRSPIHFIIGSMAVGFIGCLIGVKKHWGLGLLGFILGILCPAILLYFSNEKDNAMILKDLKWLYETITVQLQSGLYIQQALQESEGLMKNKRLRKALHQLIEELVFGGDMNLALTHFENSFRNRYISSFSMILRQMQDSGYAVKLLEDIRVQIEEMERMELMKKKETLEMQLQMFQMLLFIGVLALVMQGCILAAFQSIHYL